MTRREEKIAVELSDLDADGIGIATVVIAGQARARLELTQAEFNLLAFHAANVSIPKEFADRAAAEEARRIALGRTMVEEVLVSINVTIPASALREKGGAS